MDAANVELLYKAISSIGVGLLIYFIKDFKAEFKKLAEGLNSVSLSLQTLITKDTHKEEAISEIKIQLERLNKDQGYLKIKLALIEQKVKKSGE